MTLSLSLRACACGLALGAVACGGDDTATTQESGADDDSGSADDDDDGSADGSGSADDDADGSSTAAGTTTADTTTADTTAGDSSGSSGDASTDGSDSSSSGAPGCVPIETEDLASLPLAGDSACEGVANNAVITDADGLQAHFDEFCDSLTSCQFPAPPCDDPPAVDFDGQRIVYVFGQSSGCSGSAQIDQVLDCGDQVEVHYTIGAQGPCDLVVYAWDAVSIPDGPDVAFIEG